jgi:hypothetical protein
MWGMFLWGELLNILESMSVRKWMSFERLKQVGPAEELKESTEGRLRVGG